MHLQELIEEVLTSMRKNGTTRRGKRQNAVHWFVTSKQALQDKIAQDYTQALLDGSDLVIVGGSTDNNSNDDDMAVHLHAATRLVQNYVHVQDYLLEMRDLLPTDLAREGYKTPQDFVFRFLEAHLLSHRAMRYNEHNTFQDLSAGQAARVTCWIDCFLTQIFINNPDLLA